jgi:hypothetical protein
MLRTEKTIESRPKPAKNRETCGGKISRDVEGYLSSVHAASIIDATNGKELVGAKIWNICSWNRERGEQRAKAMRTQREGEAGSRILISV